MKTESEMKLHRCCFTGHRPEKLNMSEHRVKKLLKEAIKNAIKNGYVTFISGMARGVDIWAASIVLEERKKNDKIHLICAVPHPDFEKRWEPKEQKLYNKILDEADIVRVISEHYFRACYQKRNEWMADRSGLIIATYNGEPGGTKNTIDYARRKDIPIVNIFD